MEKSSYSTIIFDQGEVLLTNDWNFYCPEKDQLFYAHYNISEAQFTAARKKYIDQLFTGLLSETDYWKNVLTDTQAVSCDPDYAITLARKYQSFKPGMEQLIQELSTFPYRLAILSTTHKEMMAFKRQRFQLDNYFETIITSCDTGFIKPDPRIYTAALSQLQVSPSECLFIDDSQENVDAASDLGITSIRYQNTDQLIKRFAELGIMHTEQS